MGRKVMNSIWTDTVKLPEFPRLEGNHKTDVLIIGGGMAGLLCAYLLQESGVNYILVEADTIGSGITKNTTAKITSQHGLIYQDLVAEFGIDFARKYLQVNEIALKKYQQICKTIECDYETKDAYAYSIDNRSKLEKEMQTLNRIGFHADYIDRLNLPFATQGAVKFPNQAQFHPLKFIAAIAPSLNIYEHTKVTELGIQNAKINRGYIRASQIIVATHFPFNNKHGAYFLKMYQRRSYVLALSHAQDVDGMYIDEAQDGLSFRNYHNLLLLGGGGHRTGKQGGNWAELIRFQKKYYPNAKIENRWATQDCMTLDHVPYIGTYGRHTTGFYVATGFNKWGMSTAMVAAMLLKDQILGKENRYASVFDPHRTMIRPQLLVNAFEATTNLITPSSKRCPHLKCALKWNSVEHTWDCPCHGSRFEQDGELIDNPATDDMKIRK